MLGGTVDGWAAMLAAGLPADLHGDLLVTPLALSWLASLAACLLAVHTSGPIVPLGPPTAALAASLALTGEAASNRLALAVAFLGLALVLMLVRANRAVATALTEALPSAGAPLPGGAARARRTRPGSTPRPAGSRSVYPSSWGSRWRARWPPERSRPRGATGFDPRDLRDERLADRRRAQPARPC